MNIRIVPGPLSIFSFQVLIISFGKFHAHTVVGCQGKISGKSEAWGGAVTHRWARFLTLKQKASETTCLLSLIRPSKFYFLQFRFERSRLFSSVAELLSVTEDHGC